MFLLSNQITNCAVCERRHGPRHGHFATTNFGLRDSKDSPSANRERKLQINNDDKSSNPDDDLEAADARIFRQ
jgi:hypothetical protein